MESVKYDFLSNPIFIFSVLIGASVLLLMYFINMFRNQEVAEKPKNEKSTSHSEKKKDPPVSGKRKKKVTENRWVGKHEKHTFTHPWLLVSLKGHTGNILDMDFSSNGKYLASCDDEDPDPGGDTDQPTIAKEKVAREPNPSPKGLSRRQRKNMKKNNPPSPPAHPKVKKSRQNNTLDVLEPVLETQETFKQFAYPDQVFIQFVQTYLMTLDQMMFMGYPIQSSLDPKLVVIYKSPRVPFRKTVFDVNAREFVPKPKNDWSSNDSGKGSSCSGSDGEESGSGSDQDSTAGDMEKTTGDCENRNWEWEKFVYELPTKSSGFFFTRTCSRCSRLFHTTKDKCLTYERCYYHWGKLTTKNFHSSYSCCNGKVDSKGCSESKCHVWTGLDVGMNGLYDDFVRTKKRRNPPRDGNYGVYAIDCEMCYTVRGLELTKIVVVGLDGRVVYESFVKPDYEIIDYNTRFSGITAEDLQFNKTKSLREVQNDLMGFISADTILIGHGLENDLRALKLVHYLVVDTANTFPHWRGLPFRRSLKELSLTSLKKAIQNSSKGHNCKEDATVAMELMIKEVTVYVDKFFKK